MIHSVMSNTVDPALLEIGLPKWPWMQVRGVSVTVAQAEEIIRRTDEGLRSPSYNDRKFMLRLWESFGKPPWWHVFAGYADFDTWDRWAERWGFVETEYVHNNWMSCAYIGGPHGWCHPDGTIRTDHNVGKWPSVREVLVDWQTIAREFPFLDLTATLMSAECGEPDASPLCTIVVKGGAATLARPASPIPDAPDPEISPEESVARILGERSGRECGVPLGWLRAWGERSTALLKALESEANT